MKAIQGKIKDGKIIPDKKLPSGSEVEVKIYILPKSKSTGTSFFGKGKGIFGDGLKYQKKIRGEWK